jgi:hypothetical protein
MSPKPLCSITDRDVGEISEETGADRRSVIRYWAGLPVRGAAGRAIGAAFLRRGLRPGVGLYCGAGTNGKSQAPALASLVDDPNPEGASR